MSVRSGEAYKEKSSPDKFQMFLVIIIFILLVKGIYDFRLSQLTGRSITAAVLVLVLSLLPLKIKDGLTLFKDDLFLGLSPTIYLLLSGNIPVAKIAVFIGLLLSAVVPPKTRSLTRFVDETFSVYVSFIAFGVLKGVISLIPGITNWQIAAVTLLAPLFTYGYLKSYLISRTLNFKSSGIYSNYWSFSSCLVIFSIASALLMYSFKNEADYYKNLWLFLLPGILALIIYIFTIGRNNLYQVLNGVSSLITGGDEHLVAQKLSHEYALGMAYELGLKAIDMDKLALAVLSHNVGKAGMCEYSVGHIFDAISLAKGEPLHAQKGYRIFSTIPGFSDVSNIIKTHHEPAVNIKLTRTTKRELITLSQALNIAVNFAEKLVYVSNEPLTEKEVYKRLRKDSGWEFNARLLRKLKTYLGKKGIKGL